MIPRREWLIGSGFALLGGCTQLKVRRIGVIPKATSHLFFVSVHAGVEKAAAEQHIEVIWNGPSDETDHARQMQIVDSMVAQKVDAIAISGTDERALVAPLERAIAAGIPVTIFDSAVNLENYVSFIATDNHAAGCEAARALAGLIGGSGPVAMVMQKPGGLSTGLRERGFEETVAKEFPKVQIVAKQYGMADRAKSRAVAENILTAHSDLAGIFASSEATSLGTIQAIRSRGLSGKLRLVTFDTSEAHVEALKDGTIDLMMVQDPFRMGYEAVKSLAEKLDGKTPQRRLDLPARKVVKADLEKPDIKSLLSPVPAKG